MSLQDIATQLVSASENFRSHLYDDATGEFLRQGMTIKGHPTIGFGLCVEAGVGDGITTAEALMLLNDKMQIAMLDAAYSVGTATWAALDQNRQAALVDMAYELGRARLLEFHDMIRAIQTKDWASASGAALASIWAQKEASARAKRDASILLTGVLP